MSGSDGGADGGEYMKVKEPMMMMSDKELQKWHVLRAVARVIHFFSLSYLVRGFRCFCLGVMLICGRMKRSMYWTSRSWFC